MITYNKDTSILLVISSPNETIRRIYNELQQIEPQRLYLFYNAPANEGYRNYYEKIQSIFNTIQWKCKLKIFCNKTNLGYDATMLKAAGWFFRSEMEGIVLDGRSIPPPGFFAFCSCMLEKYRYDERIGHVSSWDFLRPNKRMKIKDSYYFSKLINVSSAWASWRRVWKNMKTQLKTFNSFKKLKIIDDIPSHKPFQFSWFYIYKQEEYWDDKYEYINLINNRLSVVPDFSCISFDKYELSEITHPALMVSPLMEELRFQELKHSMQAITTNKPEGVTFLHEKLLSFKSEASSRMKIPRIIHQIYEDPDGPPANLLRIAESWKESHPEWEYRFWNRQMMHDFLETTCPEFSEYYFAYPFNVQRWDAIRYLILYHIGGLYVDFDYECIRPLDVLLCGSTCCMGMEPTINSKIFNKSLIVGNALMASKPQHPYMAAIIEDMKSNFHVDYGKNDSMQIMETTGPFMVTRVYEQFKKKKEVTLLPADLVTPVTMKEVLMLRTGNEHPEVIKKIENAYAVHYFFGSWSPQTSEGKKVKQL